MAIVAAKCTAHAKEPGIQLAYQNTAIPAPQAAARSAGWGSTCARVMPAHQHMLWRRIQRAPPGGGCWCHNSWRSPLSGPGQHHGCSSNRGTVCTWPEGTTLGGGVRPCQAQGRIAILLNRVHDGSAFGPAGAAAGYSMSHSTHARIGHASFLPICRGGAMPMNLIMHQLLEDGGIDGHPSSGGLQPPPPPLHTRVGVLPTISRRTPP